MEISRLNWTDGCSGNLNCGTCPSGKFAILQGNALASALALANHAGLTAAEEHAELAHQECYAILLDNVLAQSHAYPLVLARFVVTINAEDRAEIVQVDTLAMDMDDA